MAKRITEAAEYLGAADVVLVDVGGGSLTSGNEPGGNECGNVPSSAMSTAATVLLFTGIVA